jgi:hypothetical protein
MSAYETAREIFRRSFPSQKFRPQAPPEWQGDFPLPDAVAEYYGVLGPAGVWIGAYGNSHFLPSLAELWKFQAGYRTHANTGERLPGWNDDWLLIAEQGGDPFIFSRSSGHVLHAFHGAGRWEPMEMFTNLPAMVTVLAIMGETIEHADPAFTDDDSLILPQYREEARSRIAEYLQSQDRANAILHRFDWDWEPGQ